MSESTTESTTVTETQQVEDAPTTEQETVELGDPGKAALSAERKARRDAEKANKDLETRLAAFENANKSEADKLTDRATKAEERAAAAESRYQAAETRRAITDAAVNAKTIDPDTVYHLAQASGQVSVDDDGNVVGVDKVIAGLIKSKPHLFASPAAGARDTHASSAPPALNSDALTASLMGALNIPQQ